MVVTTRSRAVDVDDSGPPAELNTVNINREDKLETQSRGRQIDDGIHVIQEMKMYNMPILGISEVRWVDSESVKKVDKFLYFPGNDKHHVNGVGFTIHK